MSRIKRLERLLTEWNDSAFDLLNPSSLSTKIYSEEDPLSATGQVILGQEKGAGGADLVVPEDVVDVLKSQEDNEGVIGKGFVTFLKTTFKDLDVDDVSYNREKQGGSYFDMVFPGNRVVSISVWGDEGDQKLAVIYKIDEDEREIEVKDLKEGAFKVEGDVNADVFPVDWLVDTVKEVLKSMSDEEEDETSPDDIADDFADETEKEEDEEAEKDVEDNFFRDEEEEKNQPKESKYRMVRYGGLRFLTERS